MAKNAPAATEPEAVVPEAAVLAEASMLIIPLLETVCSDTDNIAWGGSGISLLSIKPESALAQDPVKTNRPLLSGAKELVTPCMGWVCSRSPRFC